MQKISEDEMKLSTIWVALGVARENYAAALRRRECPDLLQFYYEQRERMQAIRDEIEDQMDRLKGLEELDG